MGSNANIEWKRIKKKRNKRKSLITVCKLQL